MIKATHLEVGHRYYDAEIKDFYKVLCEEGCEVWVKFDKYTRPEKIGFVDLLQDAFIEGDFLTVPIETLHVDAVIPSYQTTGAAGFDLHITEDITIFPNRILVSYIGPPPQSPDDPMNYTSIEDYHFTLSNDNHAIAGTGLAFEIPVGYELEIRGRSGNAFNYRVFAYNGTIDSDYRGEVKILITNLGQEPIHFKKGDRVAQGVIKRIDQSVFHPTDTLASTDRGAGGFGHTGK